MNPALGFDNMKKVATLKSPDEKASAEQQLLAGKTPDTVSELMKKGSEESQKDKLEKEKNRLEKTIASLQQRLQFVEETLETL